MTSDTNTGDNEREIHLTKNYRYDDQQTTDIPIIHAKDYGGAILVNCPDGSTRIFDRDEVRSIDGESEQ